VEAEKRDRPNENIKWAEKKNKEIEKEERICVG
jgi:hypothetical protein